jgi:hypothetical protein
MNSVGFRLHGSSSTIATALFLTHLLHPHLRRHKAEGHIGGLDTAACERIGKKSSDLSVVQGLGESNCCPSVFSVK